MRKLLFIKTILIFDKFLVEWCSVSLKKVFKLTKFCLPIVVSGGVTSHLIQRGICDRTSCLLGIGQPYSTLVHLGLPLWCHLPHWYCDSCPRRYVFLALSTSNTFNCISFAMLCAVCKPFSVRMSLYLNTLW